MKKPIALLVCLLLCFEFLGCIEQQSGTSVEQCELLVVGISDDVDGFYPWVESYDVTTFQINFNIFDGLVDFDDSFRIIPRLAKSWNNPNNLTWRFYLHENVKFHNGYGLTAEDVKFSIELVIGNHSSILKELLSSVNKVEIVNNYTVDIITKHPFPVLLNKLVDIPIVSKKYLEETTEKWPIGTGAYKLVKYDKDENITLERFSDYWNGALSIKKVIFRVYKVPEDRVHALISGEINIADHVPPKYFQDISNASGVSVKTISTPTVFYLGFDFREYNSSYRFGEKNPFSDLLVRKAVYHAINTDKIIKDIKKGYAEPASQFLSPLIFGYNPAIDRLPYDVEKAKQLLKDAGYEDGFPATLLCPEEWTREENVYEEIVSHLSEIIDIRLNLTTVDEYFKNMMARNLTLFVLGWIPATGDGGEIFDYLLRTVDEKEGYGSYNLGYYSNPEVDRITEEIARTISPGDRLDLMQTGFQIAMNDIVCVPLFISVCNMGVANCIDWNPRSDMEIRIEEITVKTKK